MEGEYLWDLVQPEERDEIARTLAEMRGGASQAIAEDWRITRRDGSHVEVEVRCSDLRRRADRRRPGAHAAGRYRAAPARAGAEAPGLPRRADRAAQPDAVPGPGGPGDGPRPARRTRSSGCCSSTWTTSRSINDTMGHSVGDELLVAAGMRLSALTTRPRHRGPARRGRVRAAHRGRAGQRRGRGTWPSAVVLAFAEPFTLAIGLGHRHRHRRRRHHRGQHQHRRAAPARGPGAVRGQGGGQAAVAPLPAGAQRRHDPAPGAAGGPGGARWRTRRSRWSTSRSWS